MARPKRNRYDGFSTKNKQAIDEYLTHIKASGIKQVTIDGYETKLIMMFKSIGTDKDFETISLKDVDKFVASLNKPSCLDDNKQSFWT